jgi:hypothetical protein
VVAADALLVAALLVVAEALVVGAAPLVVAALLVGAALLVAAVLVVGAALLVAADEPPLLVLAVTEPPPPQAARRLAAPAATATSPIERNAFRRDNTPPNTLPSGVEKKSCMMSIRSFPCWRNHNGFAVPGAQRSTVARRGMGGRERMAGHHEHPHRRVSRTTTAMATMNRIATIRESTLI